MPLLPPPEVLRRPRFGLADLWVVVLLLSVLLLIAHLGSEASVAYHPDDQIRPISLNPINLPDYAARSCLRMFMALACSTLFSLVYGSLAARHPLAERVLIPVLDVLQSVPVLGFLSLTVTGFIALFPGSLLGLEAANGLMLRGMDVTVVHIAPWLMERQLDDVAGKMLQRSLEERDQHRREAQQQRDGFSKIAPLKSTTTQTPPPRVSDISGASLALGWGGYLLRVGLNM